MKGKNREEKVVRENMGWFIKRHRRLGTMLVAFFILIAGAVTVSAETREIKVTGTYGQTEARSMLKMINDLRTGKYTDGGQSGPWAYDENNNIDTATYANLSELTYDYELERTAMLRAMEIAVSFEHTRPDGRQSFTAFPSSYISAGENIAAGQTSAQEAFVSWSETDDPYSGQGHRRNMLSPNFNCIGIGHVMVTQGNSTIHYWTHALAKRSNIDTTMTAPTDTETTVTVSVDMTNVSSRIQLTPSLTAENISVYESKLLPRAIYQIKMPETWPLNFINTSEECVFSSSDPEIASVSGNASNGMTVTGNKAGSASILVKSPNNDANASIDLTVNKLSMTNAEAELPGGTYTYTGNAWEPEPSAVTVNGRSLTLGQDYTVSYQDNKNAGTAKVILAGTGNYENSTTLTFTIEPASLADANVSAENVVYTGEAQEPVPSVTLDGKMLQANTDYTVSYTSNTNAGTATVTVNGTGNYKDTASGTFTIEPAGIEGAQVAVADQTYTGKALTPALSVTLDGASLKAETDYTVAYSNNTQAGPASVTVTGVGNYKGTASGTFTIQPANIESAQVTIADQTYTGEALTPAPTVTLDGVTLTAGTDYTAAYSDNTQVGIATVTVTGTGNYTGTASGKYAITPVSLKNAVVTATGGVYTGEAQEPVPSVTLDGKMLQANTDYTVSYTSNTNAGTATVTVNGTGNYKDTASGTFTIEPAGIEGAQVAVADQTYTGEALTPAPRVTLNGATLTAGTDYTAAYSNNTQTGPASVTVTGVGNYKGTASGTFTIQPANIEDAQVAVADQTYTGEALTPAPRVTLNGVTLTAGIDYTAAYSDNTQVGTATVTVTGTGNYTGTASGKYAITPVSLKNAVVTVTGGVYTGEGLKPVPTVTLDGKTLQANTDFIVSYRSNLYAGTATVVVDGIGNYKDTVSVSFIIEPAGIESAQVAIADQIYTGKALTPALSVTLDEASLKADKDYTAAYSNNTQVGTASVTLTGVGNYKGTASGTFTIQPANIESAQVTIADQTYTGKALTPAPTVTLNGAALTAGTDYTVAYNNNTQTGRATVTVTGMGNYKGTASGSFNITTQKATDTSDKQTEESGSSGTKTNETDSPETKTDETDSTETKTNDPGSSGTKTDETGTGATEAEVPETEAPVSAAKMESTILKTKSDGDMKGSTFGLLSLKGTPASGKSIKLTWKKVPGATKYVIYGNRCGKNNKYKKIAAVKGSKKTYTVKKLKKGTYYKYLVVAVKGQNAIATSKTIHVATKGGKVGNPKSIRLSAKNITLKKGRSMTVKATVKNESLKVKKHRAVAWESSKKSVAKVSKKGKIKAVGKGSCYIYAYTQNGIAAKVKVKVTG